MRRLALLLTLLATTAFALDRDAGVPAKGLVDWLCGLLGFACSGGLDAVRSDNREWGTEVRRFNPQTRTERVLFKCTSCRSPLPVHARRATAVATPGGVLMVGDDLKRREVPVPGLVQLIALAPDAGARLLALTESTSDAGAVFRLVVIDLDDAGLEVLGEVPAQELAIRPGQASESGVVFGKNGTGDLALSSSLDRRSPKLLLQHGDQLKSPAARFDPIWAVDGGVIYTARVAE